MFNSLKGMTGAQPSGLKKTASHKNGYGLVEALLALVCLVIVVNLGQMLLVSVKGILEQGSLQAENFYVLQLRQFAALQDQVHTDNGKLLVHSAAGDFKIMQDKDRLVKIGGYEILAEKIESAWFYEKGNEIWLEIKKDGKTSIWQIC